MARPTHSRHRHESQRACLPKTRGARAPPARHPQNMKFEFPSPTPVLRWVPSITHVTHTMGQTLFEKVWESHAVGTLANGQTQLLIDTHLVHEVT
ncbi:MAG TPA: hypothetical protein DIT64_08815, partial [Verrucomicrobiales bacterium]|nr:hypothetical protein [Verrucomicrobiales bacterium]